jgi:hypothetical protein
MTAIVNLDHIPITGIHALDQALEKGIPEDGLILEFGVWQGSSIRKIAAKHPTRKIYGFDSFEGLPERWERDDMNFHPGFFSTNGRLPPVQPNVTLVKGWFCDTLPSFVNEHRGAKIALLHIDCDLYSSTRDVFTALKDMIQDGTVIVFDELVNYPNYENGELKALEEFLSSPNNDRGLKLEWWGCKGPIRKDNPVDMGPADQAVCGVFVCDDAKASKIL